MHIIVPFAPGGGTSTAARLIADNLSKRWGQPVLIDNRPGGNTVIGAQAVARAPNDGYTLLFANSSFSINPLLMPKLPYDSDKDFTPVTSVLVNRFVALVHPSVPAKSLQALVGLMRANPDGWNLPTVGAAGVGRVAAESFASAIGVHLQNIPYKGTSELATNLLGGEVRFAIEIPGFYIPHVHDGRLRALAVTGKTRLASLPDVPTFAEAGLPNFDIQSWYGLMAPAGTPAPIVDKIADAVQELMQTPEVRQYLAKIDADPLPHTPAEFGQMIQTERARFARVIEERQIRPAN